MSTFLSSAEPFVEILTRPRMVVAMLSLLVSVAVCIATKPSKLVLLKTALRECEQKLFQLVDQVNCAPILLRLAFCDASSYETYLFEWPDCGGCNGSVLYETHLPGKEGLQKMLDSLKQIKAAHPMVSWADLIQMGGAVAVEACGGPHINMKYGRIDLPEPENDRPLSCPFQPPQPEAPFEDGAVDASTHIRNVFYRMGFSNREIVALCGAHTIGRCFQERSGYVEEGYGEGKATQYTSPSHICRHDGRKGIGMAGGRSWTRNWLTFDNAYFLREPSEEDLCWFETDESLRTDPEFKKVFAEYAQNEESFFRDYASAHKRMSELGCRWRTEQGLVGGEGFSIEYAIQGSKKHA